MQVHHLNCGTMRPFGGRMVDGSAGFLRRAELVCHCLLIDTGTTLALVETGMGSPAVDDPGRWLGERFARLIRPVTTHAETAREQVRALGYDPKDVRHIVLTHLDLDHAGGLVDFPQATVHVYAEELRAFESPRDAAERDRYRAVQFEHGPQWRSYGKLGETWFGFDAVRELDDLQELLLIPLAGHTRGHAGVAVDTGDRWLLHAGDAYFFHGQLEAGMHRPPGLALFEKAMQMDARQRRHNARRLNELVRTHGDEVEVFNAHSSVQLRRQQATASAPSPRADS